MNILVDTFRHATQISTFQCLNTLQTLEGIYIKQKYEKQEPLSGFQTTNVFKVYSGNKDGDKESYDPIFKAKEKSRCCQRICCPGDCRSFDIKVKQLDRDNDHLVIEIRRDCKCTCLCLNRPHLEVKLKSGDYSEYIGRIYSPYKCCDSGVHIIGRQDDLRFKIKTNCCQLGFFCKLPCNEYKKISFDIMNPFDDKIGELQKVIKGFCTCSFESEIDCFKVPFPQNCSPEDKALIMAATLFIDYRFFETNQKEQEM